ncbi:GntR family transcriptional regulator protein (plasmid) [Rhizobium etli 8C-3]|jgi:DNA-binding GntR family transcriptional regulator|uniref:DNA-binding GntR family transcriptional regulator n=2 Tax=Rhizobium TaxID=379 RepID=A0A4R3RQR1_9HYPH|nr:MULTISPECIES: GntR family transcriptional regulator [Rhizobium]APO78854.1 GntR family transcriptional regulator protein [Rhizobium etli 8C-3]TCU28827.1 DNA-binding GntR family transcriptional regulator [Rhizobium azibense]TCU33916.1 DNA-binding GntR family transcriptional regulator [Rhizobium azibense]
MDSGHSALQIDIARQILLQAQKEGWRAGHQIVEKSLASAFGVSRSPMRGALEILEEKALVRLIPNKGFVAAVDLGSEKLLESLTTSETERLKQQVLHDRSRGLIPQEVSENELTERYQVARGILRKALAQLSSQGLIHRQRGHGWAFVDSLDSAESLAESYRFRLAVELAGLSEPDYRAEPEALDALIAAHENVLGQLHEKGEIGRPEWLQLNASFHEALARWSGNRFILQAVRMQNDLRLLRESSVFDRLQRERIEASLDQHLQILHHIKVGDLEIARIVLKRHLEVILRNVEQRIAAGDR